MSQKLEKLLDQLVKLHPKFIDLSLNRLSLLLNKNNIPYIVILTDPTTGGVTASFAMLADITIAEKDSTIGFAGKRVIQDTIREELPVNFQKAEYLKDHGMIDIVVHRKKLKKTISDILYHICNN